jgi:hypothetical protein
MEGFFVFTLTAGIFLVSLFDRNIPRRFGGSKDEK